MSELQRPPDTAAAGAFPLTGLDDLAREKLLQDAQALSLRPRRRFLRAAEPLGAVYLLAAGAVRRSFDGGRRQGLLELLEAPSIVGAGEALTRSPCSADAITLTPCLLWRVPTERFLSLLTAEPGLSKPILLSLAQQSAARTRTIEALTFGDVRLRLLTLLADYARVLGRPTVQGVELNVGLSQEQLAADLAVSRRAVGVALASLRQEGFVTKRLGRYILRGVT